MSAGPSGGRRWWLWVPLLGLGSWLALFGDRSPASDAALSLPARPRPGVMPAQSGASSNPAEPPAHSNAQPLLALVPRERLFPLGDSAVDTARPGARDMFSTRSWNPPAPASPTAVEAPPTAPPLPYIFLGKKLEGDAWEVFLAKGEQTFVARANQVIENDWRVDKIEPPTLALTYLPLGLSQTLSIGDSR